MNSGQPLNKDSSLPPRLELLLEGLNEPGDCKNPPTCPDWLDKGLFDRGRRLYRKYLFCFFFAELLGLLCGFSLQRLRTPLIFTKRSSSRGKAMRRYVSTSGHIKQWFEKDVWNPEDEGHTDIMGIRATHCKVSQCMKESRKECSEGWEASGTDSQTNCPFSSMIRADLKTLPLDLQIDLNEEPVQYFSQFDMAITQYSFVGLIVAHPRMMGLRWVTDEDMEGFIHFWRGVGWLLGIDDKYNLCNGRVQDVRTLCLDIEKHIIHPNLSQVSTEFEEMAQSLMEGINLIIPAVSLEAMFLYLASTLNLAVPSLRLKMSWKHFLQYSLMRFVFSYLFLIPSCISFFNFLLQLALEIVNGNVPKWFPCKLK